ncbi:MAG: adenylate/guanylate cyclase domain-containing protein [Burkholderiaceae bacterium]|nr:adenylate/guanylate cyclase domain-containing protein [Burkholderiaceae bacterium]
MTALQRSRLLRSIAGMAIVLVFVTMDLGLLRVGGLGALDRELYDGRQRSVASVLDERIVIVDIDERSLGAHGRWPWDRAKIAQLLDAIIEQGRPAVVGLDIVFAEKQADGDDDARLARALADRPVVLGYYFTSNRGAQASGALPMPLFEGEAAKELRSQLTHADGYGANLAPLQQAARASGFFNPFLGGDIDPDGVIRALPLLATHGGAVYESLAVAVLRQYLGNGSVEVDPRADTMIVAGERARVQLPVSVGFTAMVPVAGRGGPDGGHFRYVSAADVLAGQVDWKRMQDRIVLIGTTAPGQTDLRATSVSEVFPGVEIHAALIAGALDGVLKQRPDGGAAAGAMATALVGGLLALVLPALGVVGAVAATSVGALVLFGTNAIAWSNFGLALPLAASIAAVLCLGLFNLVVGWFAEGRARRAVLARFGEYVSPALVEQMAHDPVNWQVAESSNRELTILFADIRGFTRIAEAMQPEPLREYINTFLTAMTEVIHAHRGTVDKYMGDAVMAFWGAPVDDAGHAEHAVAAALAMQREVARLSAGFVTRGLPPLAVGIGVNTGVVRVGDMGSKLRRAYTVIGDAVNLASRLESLTRRYEVPIIVGEATAQRCRHHRFRELARTTIAGRTESVRIFVPGSLDDDGGEGLRRPTIPMPASAPTNKRATESLHEGSSPGV